MEKRVKKNKIEICTESFGDTRNPSLLLMMGAGASMVWWDTEFCQKLADKGFHVIRYDNRDMGQSSCSVPFQPDYDVLNMADDVLNILDAYQIEKAHLAGMSLGGMLAQITAIRNPERVSSLTLISSSVWDDLPYLPQIDKLVIEYHSSVAGLDWEDKEAIISYMVDGWQLLNGSRHPFEEKQARKLATTEVERANNLHCMLNHSLIQGGESLYGKSKEITIPTLIIHGTEDIVLPFAHAEALHHTIPHSELMPLNGAGHEIHRLDWDTVIEGIIRFIIKNETN